MFSSLFVCLSVCLFLSNFAQKTSERICMKFSGKVGNRPMNKRLNFGGDLDQGCGLAEVFTVPLVMAALCNRACHYILPCDFYLSSSIFYLLFSSPNLSGRRLDVYHTSTHGVALVRI